MMAGLDEGGARGTEAVDPSEGHPGAPESAEARLRAARRVLAEAGIDAPVRAAGTDGEIAAVQGPATLRDALARVAPELQKLGFRYVALELNNDEGEPERDT